MVYVYNFSIVKPYYGEPFDLNNIVIIVFRNG